jgi:ElaB/YqjD/DUF883 family membrane-anchored ribosome-binding protein
MAQQSAGYPLDYSKGPDPIAKDRSHQTADNATDQLKNLADKAQDMASKASEQAREYGERAQDAARNFKPFVEKSMKEQPMGTLAAAALIGFALGALWKK